MTVLMLELRKAEIKEESITVHINQGQILTKQLKYKDKTSPVMVHLGQTNVTTTICLLTEEEWRNYISEDHDIV